MKPSLDTPTLADSITGSPAIRQLIERAITLGRANRALHEALDPEIAVRVRLVNFSDRIATLLVDSPATSSLLRYREQALLKLIHSSTGIECDRLRLKVDPSLLRATSQTPPRRP